MNILLLKVGTLTTYLLLSLSIYAERREMIRMFKKEPKAFVFGDKVNLRAEPSKTAKIVTVLPIGTELKIGEIVESPDESDQFAWVQSETKDGKKGYVHETLITVHTLKLKDSKSIYLGIANAATPQYELRLVETNTLLSRLTLPKKYVNFISFERIKTDFASPPYFLRVSDSTGDACGEPIYHTLIQIKDDALSLLLENTGYIDADLGLFYDYRIIKEPTGRFKILEIEDHVIEDLGSKYKHEEKRTVYGLEGGKVTKLTQKKRRYVGPIE